MNSRAYSQLIIKSTDEAARTFEGIATTPTPDRMQDVVEPRGAEFKLPLPFLWQHDSGQPIGWVTSAKATDEGIPVTIKMATIDEPGTLQNRINEAWQSIKSGLVRGLSIGFSPLEYEPLRSGGLRFLKWSWLELSAVTIPANAEASIGLIKSLDQARMRRKARGPIDRVPGHPGAVRLLHPGQSYGPGVKLLR